MRRWPTVEVMRPDIFVVVMLIALGACSGTPDTEPSDRAQPSGSAGVNLAQACPKVEVALPDSLTDEAERHELQQSLSTIRNEGDHDARVALDPIIAAVDNYATTDIFDARAAYRDALSELAERCEAVGSSALQ